MKKQIPTIVGLLVLLGALISGLLFFGNGTGVFAPRATAETTPKNIRITNIKDDSFTVTFSTQKATSGFVKYGTEANKLNSQTSDDRDQLSGTVGEFNMHHITLRGLNPATEYYFVLGTDLRTEFDNEGQPFSLKTPQKITAQMPDAVTVYGSVSNEGGTPAEGTIVYVSNENMGDLSALVKGSGSWAVPLSQALTSDSSDYARLDEGDILNLVVQGLETTSRIQYQVLVKDAQPVRELTFGQVYDELEIKDSDEEDQEDTEDEVEEENEDEEDLSSVDEDSEEATISGRLLELLDEADPLPGESTAAAELVLGGEKDEPAVTNASPLIIGEAKPNVEIRVSVHSETNYQTTLNADQFGKFQLNLEELGLELEPGEHTVTYSYIDPDTGQEVTTTETFLVEDSSQVMLAQANTPSSNTYTTATSPTPTPTQQAQVYGTGSPYPMSTPTPTPIISTSSSTISTDSTSATRKQPVGTDSALTKAGSIGATTLMMLAGVFFITMGSWSWWVAAELEAED